MRAYNIIMLSLVAVSVILTVVLALVKGNKQLVCSVNDKTLPKTSLAAADIQQISKTCNSWYISSKLWCCVYYSLSVLTCAASVITIYIASSENYAIEHIVLYSIIALICSMTMLILRCDTKTIKDRQAYNTLHTMLYKHEIGLCTDSELIDCFDMCESEITKFYL